MNKGVILGTLCTLVLAMFILTANPRTTLAQEASLFERLGGIEFITCWIDESLVVILADRRIDDFFQVPLRVLIADHRQSLIDFACSATGGGCIYSGANMSCAHRGLSISNVGFNAFIEDLETGARECARPEPAYSELVKVLRGLRPQIVQDDPGESPEEAQCVSQ